MIQAFSVNINSFQTHKHGKLFKLKHFGAKIKKVLIYLSKSDNSTEAIELNTFKSFKRFKRISFLNGSTNFVFISFNYEKIIKVKYFI